MTMQDMNLKYRETLLLYFEEEIMGIAYFEELARCFSEPHQKEKMGLLARVESHAAEAVRPLLLKYDLKPRPESELQSLGRKDTDQPENQDWNTLINDMSTRYVGYVDDFEALEKMAPTADLPELKILTGHEVAAVEFANLEIAGNPDSSAPLRAYLGSQ